MQALAGVSVGLVVAVIALLAERYCAGSNQTFYKGALRTLWNTIVMVGASAVAAGLVAWHIDFGYQWPAFVPFASIAPFLAAIDIAVRR